MTSRKRSYNSELRARQAEDTRRRVVRAAAQLFSERGYAATTMPRIAATAGVSTETVQSYGPKSNLLRAATDLMSFGGARDQPITETELGQPLLQARTPREAASAIAELLAQANKSVDGLWLAFLEAARHDPVIADELRALVESIRAQNEAVLRGWQPLGWLQPDVPLDELVNRAVLIGAVELYDRHVRLSGQTFESYRSLIEGLLLAAVLKG